MSIELFYSFYNKLHYLLYNKDSNLLMSLVSSKEEKNKIFFMVADFTNFDNIGIKFIGPSDDPGAVGNFNYKYIEFSQSKNK